MKNIDCKKLVLQGYFGRNNFGDEVMLRGFIEKITTKFTLIASKDIYLNRKFSIVLNDSLLNRFKTYLRSDTFIWLGGTCFYSNIGLNGLLLDVLLAKLLRNRIYFVGVGIGDVTTITDRYKIKLILFLTSRVLWRDSLSYNRAAGLGYNRHGMIPDLAILYFSTPFTKISSVKSRCLVINLIAGIDDFWKKDVNKILSNLSNDIDEIYLLPGEFGEVGDMQALSVFGLELEKLGFRTRLCHPQVIDDVISIMAQAKYYLGMRLHLLYLADVLKIPSVAIRYSPKIQYYNETYGGSTTRLISHESANVDYAFSNCVIDIESEIDIATGEISKLICTHL